MKDRNTQICSLEYLLNDSGLRNTEDILLKLATRFSCNYNLNDTFVYIKLLEGPSLETTNAINTYHH